LDFHSADNLRGASRDRMLQAVDVNKTKPARARRLQAIVLAERGDFYMRQMRGLQDGRTLRHVELAVVDANFHGTNFVRRGMPFLLEKRTLEPSRTEPARLAIISGAPNP